MNRSCLHHALIVSSALALTFAVATPRVSGQAPKEPDSVILKGAPMGGVKFEHRLHAKDRQVKCQSCHHPSKAAKPAKSEHQKCTDCHTKVAAAPMKVNTRDAFHDAMAKKGLCVDCHATENGKGKKAPVKCLDCHKKEHA
jgi:hypothetical protein